MRAVPAAESPSGPRGIITALHRRGCVVEHAGRRMECKRVKGEDLCVGDEVLLHRVEDSRAGIAERLPRRSWFARGVDGGRRTKLVAANVDVLAIVVAAAEPALQATLIDRFYALARVGRMDAIICMNKMDLADGAAVDAALAPYAAAGIAALRLSAIRDEGIETVAATIAGKRALFCGHSGVGKSTLINALVGDHERLRTGEVSAATGKGIHTTTWIDWIELDDATVVIDTPGVKQVSLGMLDRSVIQQGFPEFAPFARDCHFDDCTHRQETDCAVRAAADAGGVHPTRYATYRTILANP